MIRFNSIIHMNKFNWQKLKKRLVNYINWYLIKNNIKIKKRYYFFKNTRPTIVPTKVKDPMTAATNTVSATDANGSPMTAINIDYIIIINPINANSPKTIDLISSFWASLL